MPFTPERSSTRLLCTRSKRAPLMSKVMRSILPFSCLSVERACGQLTFSTVTVKPCRFPNVVTSSSKTCNSSCDKPVSILRGVGGRDTNQMAMTPAPKQEQHQSQSQP